MGMPRAAGGKADERLSVEVVPLPPVADLEPEWRELESRSCGSYLTGWSWIGCWIGMLGGAVALRLVRARSGERTVALGILGESRSVRHRVIYSRSLRLHATGRPEFDILAIECNGFVVERGREEAVSARILAHLLEHERGWDELVLDGLWGRPQWVLEGHRTRTQLAAFGNHWVDLEAVRKRGEYLPLLGAKTRANIRRSIKEYEQFGPLSLRCAADAGEARAFLDGLRELHQRYWTARGEPGAFANPFFDRFHARLVGDAFARGEIQLVAVTAGEKLLGYIYNFVHQGRIYNYQLGLDYELCEKHNRPGLVAHAYAVEFNARLGHAVYDFMMGETEYKQALGTDRSEMSWVVVQRDRLRFRAEALARRVRDRLRQARARPAAGAPAPDQAS